ncbi:HEAT repeat domain-containing protein [Actinomadura sp. 6N118]|uniref:HEAT repeat domain-containing protein n=1 Tax=Actinomadura sp. 6N118 TaxID=3375151 RepID=UPI003799481D
MTAHPLLAFLREFDNFDEPGESSGRGMRGLVAALGLAVREHPEWSDLVPAAWNVELTELSARLDHPDLEIRRMVSHVLEWFWTEADEALQVIKARLENEDDAPARFGLIMAAARLGPHASAPAEPWFAGLLGAENDPVVRFAAALGWCEHMRPAKAWPPAAVLDALIETIEPGDAALEAYWGGGWDTGLGTVQAALHDRPRDMAYVLLSIAERHPQMTPAVSSRAGQVLIRARQPKDAAALVPLLARSLHDPDERARADAARALAYVPGEISRPAMDDLAAVLDDPKAGDHALIALAKAGDERAVPALLRLLGEERLPLWISSALEHMGAHADALVPAVLRRLEDVPPITVVFLEGGGVQVRGGLRVYESDMLREVAGWGSAAAPLVPQLRRIHALYLAEQERCAGRISPDFYPLEQGILVTGRALELVG